MKADRDSTLERVRRSLEDFIADLKQVAPDRFLKPAVGEWSPRDVAAHIVGWLRLTIVGCEDLSRGVTPQSFADGENDFANVNARLVGENPSRDPDEVVRGLRDSFAELVSYARALPPQAWEAQTGVLYAGRQVTIGSNVAILAHDIDAHRHELGAPG